MIPRYCPKYSSTNLGARAEQTQLTTQLLKVIICNQIFSYYDKHKLQLKSNQLFKNNSVHLLLIRNEKSNLSTLFTIYAVCHIYVSLFLYAGDLLVPLQLFRISESSWIRFDKPLTNWF